MRSLIAIVLGFIALAACNTVQGVGQDIQDAGKGLERGAKKVEKAITE
ncbi:MAG: entericidin A/B family lipoprotein [Pseudomonadota bacterium]